MYNTDKGKKLKIVIAIIFFFITIYWGLHAGEALNTNKDCNNVISALVYGIFSIFEDPLSLVILLDSDSIVNTAIGVGGALIVYTLALILLYIDAQRHRHFDKNTACGSAKWYTDLKKYNKKYSDPKGSASNNGPENMILTADVLLNLNGHLTRKNNNVTVVGGSGSGKTRFFIKPNILQANCNYVITDPKGDLLKTTGSFLESQGYEIKVFNLVEMWKSDCYNPFNYIRDDLGVVMMIKCLIKNTTPPGQKSGDPFWEKSEEALLQALCFYLVHHRDKKYHNFSTVMKLLRLAEVDERNPSFKSPLDKLFDDVEKADPNSIALKQYKTFKMGAGKTLKSILISCSVRLTVFNLSQIESLTGKDTIELDKMGEGKKALYVIIPSADSTYNFLVSMMYSQLFETLYYMAETQYKKNRLKSRVRFLMDEFANIGEVPEFPKKLATMRQYEISCSIVLQNLAQIKAMYKDDWPSILGNCDSFLFLGGQEYETVEYISKELGEQTIVSLDRSMSNGKSSSASQSYKTTSRKLMTPDELIHMDEDECVLMIRGLDPFRTKKYEYTEHPNYRFTGDAADENEYVNKKDNRVIKTTEEIDIQEEREKAQKFTEAEKSATPSTRIIGDIKNAEGFCKSLGVADKENAKERFVSIEPAPPIPATEKIAAENIAENGSITSEVKQIEVKNDIVRLPEPQKDVAGSTESSRDVAVPVVDQIDETIVTELQKDVVGSTETSGDNFTSFDVQIDEATIAELQKDVAPPHEETPSVAAEAVSDNKKATPPPAPKTEKTATPPKTQELEPAQEIASPDPLETSNSAEKQATNKKTYPNKPSEKTLMRREKITTGAPIIKDKESEQEIWDFD